MGDTVITGIFTLLGTLLGFGLLKISDWLKERKERKKSKTLLIFKLLQIRSTIVAMKAEADDLMEITKIEDLNKILDVLVKVDMNKEMNKIEFLFEKIFNPDIKDPKMFTQFVNLNIRLNNLLTITMDNPKQNFPDLKPSLIKLMNDIINNIEEFDTLVYAC